VTFTATVAPGGAGTPTGTVSFFDGGASIGQGMLTIMSGVTTATFGTSSLAVGSHPITASYLGDGSFASSSGSLASGQVVNKAGTTLAVNSSVNPSISGQAVTFTATVSVTGPGSTAAGNPTGTVNFFDGGTNIGQGMLSTSGATTTASLSTSSLTVATHTITASYIGDGNFSGSNGTLSGGQVVNKAGTGLALTSSANPSGSGQVVIFTATVTVNSPGSTAVANPTGTVTFRDGSTSIGVGTL